MEWMYKNSVDEEDYLLGRRIGKSYAEDTESKEIFKKTSHREISADNQFTQVDESKKLLEDPLMYIKKKELESKKELLKNPIKLKRLQEAKQNSAVIVSGDSNSASHTLEYCLLVTNAIWSILKYMPDTINVQSLLEYVQHKRASSKPIKGSELYRKFCRKKKKTLAKPNCKGKSKQKQQKPIVKAKHKTIVKTERSSVDSKENAEKAGDRFVTVISSGADSKRISRNTVKQEHRFSNEYRSCSDESYNDKHCRRRPVKNSDHGGDIISREDKYTTGDNEKQHFYSDSKSAIRDQQQHYHGHRPMKRSVDRSLSNKKRRSCSSERTDSDSSDSHHSSGSKPQLRISQYKKQHGEISDSGKDFHRHEQRIDNGHHKERHAVYSREHIDDRHHGLGDARYRERVGSQHRKRSDDRRHERSDVPYRERSDNRRHECHRDGRRFDNEQARHHERGSSHRPSYDHTHDRESDDIYRREKDDNGHHHKRSDRYIERIVITRNFAAPGNTSSEDTKRKSNRDIDRYEDKRIRKSDDSSVHSSKMQQSRNTKALLDNEKNTKKHKESSANVLLDVKNDSSRQKLKDKEEKRLEMMKNAKWRDEQQSYSKACMKLLDERTNSREADKFKEDFAIKLYSHALSESSVESRIKSNIHNVQKLSSSSHKNDFVRR